MTDPKLMPFIGPAYKLDSYCYRFHMALFDFFTLSLHAPENLALWVILVFVLFQLILWLRNHLTRHSISYLPGPEKTDWLFGNLTDLHFKEVGVSQFSWQKKYGHCFKIHGLLGEHYLMTSDPKALHHIYTNSEVFVRQTNTRELLEMIMGPGLVTVHGGEAHKRQRRMMQPAFSISQLKGLYPIFTRHTEKLSIVMKKDIEGGIGRRTATLDIHDYVVNATLDIIGDAAFDYQFGALDRKQDELRDVLHESSGSLRSGTKLDLLLQYGLERLPTGLISFISRFPIPKFSHLRATYTKLSTMAEQLVKEKTDALAKGLEGGQDVMSLLIRANAQEQQFTRLSDLEVISQIATMTFTGHGTSANTLSFALWELASNVDLQRKLRQEISETWQRVQEKGEREIVFDEYENMPLLVAFMKEVLRCHPVVFVGGRQALEDSVIPLSHPIQLESGKVVNEIPISKGQQIWASIPGYNRLPELFGADAYEFNVDRWLDEKKNKTSGQGVGIYANLLTFGYGSRACLGWRFSIWETQMLLIELISKFEFTLPKNGKKVCRTHATLMIPTVEGEHGRDALFLDVSAIGG